MEEKKETKLCKYCQTEIPAKARVCPNCRRAQGFNVKLGILVIVLVVIAYAIGKSGNNTGNTEQKGNGVNEASTESVVQNDVVSNNKEPEVKEVSDSDFSIKEYKYENQIGDTLYFLVITNNSDTDVSVSGNATAKDESGNSIGAGDMSIDILGAGETSIGYFYFDSVSGIDKVEYTLDYNEKPYYKPVVNNLLVEQTLNSENVTISVTNNAEYPVLFVEAYALFFDGNDNVVGYNSTYVTDSDSEIKPSKTISAQLDCYNGYDHVEVYFTGRADK